jgi:DNA-binding transcriptional ArsR family regulator
MAGSGDRESERENHYRRAAMFHPLRQRIARVLSGGAEVAAAELSTKLEQPLGTIGRHLRVLRRRGVLKVVPRRRPTPPLYRWADDAEWAREMLVEEEDE